MQGDSSLLASRHLQNEIKYPQGTRIMHFAGIGNKEV